MSAADLSSALSLESVWLRFLDVFFVYLSVLFVLLLYLVTFKSRDMQEYRWCLTANIVSIYLFVVVAYLYKPFVLAKG